jgi:hypothetical protein
MSVLEAAARATQPARVDARRLAENPVEGVQVMDVQIQHAAARERGVVEPVGPRWVRQVAPGHGGERLAQGAALDEIRHGNVFGPEAQHVGQHEDAAARFRCGDHLVALVQRERHGLLEQHMLAGIERGHCVVRVQIGGQGDADGVHVFVRRQCVRICKGLSAHGRCQLGRLFGIAR